MNEIIKLLYIEYDIDTCKEFINHTIFTMKYLLCIGFSIGIKDCVLDDRYEIEYGISKSLMKEK